MPLVHKISDAQAIAKHYGGKCLSKEYINNRSPLKWMCSKGHTWDNPYFYVQQGTWCIQCSRHDSVLDRYKAIAEKKGGKCLSEKFIGKLTKLKWECENGHVFLMEPLEIKRRWCKHCKKIIARKKKLETFKKIAKQRNGICLSKEFINQHKKLEWKCEKKHKWIDTPSRIMQGKWCQTCLKEKNNQKRIDAVLIRLQKYAEQYKGTLISKSFINYHKHLKWQCINKHTWLASADSVYLQKCWCPICHYDKLKLSAFESYKQLAKNKGGKILSDKYFNSTSPLKWQCSAGHQWITSPDHIKQGGWCPVCNHKNRRLKIDVFHKIAKTHNGKLISKEYNGIKGKLKWLCSEGHIWASSPVNIKLGSWCPVCANKKRGRHSKKIK